MKKTMFRAFPKILKKCMIRPIVKAVGRICISALDYSIVKINVCY